MLDRKFLRENRELVTRAVAMKNESVDIAAYYDKDAERRAALQEVELALAAYYLAAIVACVGGGSNAAGIFHPFVEDESVRLVGVEAGGKGNQLGEHAAPLNLGSPGVLHGSLSYVLQNKQGQTCPVHSISAGLDYPGVGPEHSYWKDSHRASYTSVTDAEALDAFCLLSKLEGIIPALESAHAVAHAVKLAGKMNPDQTLVINLSGRGDKDVDEAARLLEISK